MNGLGGLNKSEHGVVIGLVQLQNPTVATKTDLAAQTQRVVDLVGRARRNLGTMDLVVFPEYALHGLSMDMNPDIMCRMDGPEVAAFSQACIDNRIWGCFSIMEFNPNGNPYNTALIIDDYGYLEGARKAVDEYLASYPHPVFLHRIDTSGRLVVKPREVAR